MDFGAKLKKLRLARGMTQDALARLFSVSAQAISRWENNTTMPDIGLIPAIANYFEVTTDYLLGVDINKKNERISEIIKEATAAAWQDNSSCYMDPTGLEILRNGLKMYPDSWRLKELAAEFATYLLAVPGCDTEALRDEANRLYEDIFANCPDEILRRDALSLFCTCAENLDRTERACELAKSFPYHTVYTRDYMLAQCLKGKELVDHLHDYILNGFFNIADSLFQLAKGKSAQEMRGYYKKEREIFSVLYDGDDFYKCNFFYVGAVSKWAFEFASVGDFDTAFEIFNYLIENYRYLLENGFNDFSPIVPETYLSGIHNEMKTRADILKFTDNDAREIADRIERDFPEEFRRDARCQKLTEKLHGLMK